MNIIKKKKLNLIICLFLVLTISLSGCSIEITDKATTLLDSNSQSSQNTASNPIDRAGLKVHFLDVGQADAILITTGDATMLIDAGNNSDGDGIVAYIKNQNIKKIDYIVATHSHEDHIGGLDDVITAFDIGKIIMPKEQSNTKTFEDVLDAISAKGLKIASPVVGTEYDLGNAKFKILSPSRSDYDETNPYSIVLKLTFGSKSFIFTGDSEKPNEIDMLNSGVDLKADVLKIAHHGSDSSSSASFVKAVAPDYAVISVGKNNKYGHPSSATLELLNNQNIITYRTDVDGTVVAWTDGETIKFEKLNTTIEANAKQEQKKEIIVYITKSSSKYHTETCKFLSDSKIAVSLNEAKDKYTPCNTCNPPK